MKTLKISTIKYLFWIFFFFITPGIPISYCWDDPESSLYKVFSPIKLDSLSKEKPHSRHFIDRSQTQSESLSIDKYTFSQFHLFSIEKTHTINKSCRGSYCNINFLFWIWIDLRMTKFYTSLVAYPKVGKLYKLPHQCGLFPFRIWQKSYSAFSKVVLKEPKDDRDISRTQSSFFEYFLHE